MPSYYYRRRGSYGGKRYYRRYYRSKYKRYYRNKYYSYARNYVNSSSKSTVRIKVPVESTGTFTQAANTIGTNAQVVAHPWISNGIGAYSALSSPLYRTYATLYDEVKCIGAKVRIAVTTPIGTSAIPALKIYTAWDRRLGYSERSPNITFDRMKNYSTMMCATAVNNSVAKIQRSLYASDLLEKAQWHDATVNGADNVWSDGAFEDADANPNFFCPGLLMAIEIPGVTTQQNINMTVDIRYYFAFRNPKFGAGAASAKMADENMKIMDVPEGVVREHEELPDEDIDDIVVPVKKKVTSVRK